jgi:FixJ family two-component response regulator
MYLAPRRLDRMGAHGSVSQAGDTVVVIDDDASVREALASLLESVGLRVELYGSASEYFIAPPAIGATCLVLDVRLPGQSGLEIQRVLAAAGNRVPVIFITGHGDIPMSVQAMKNGAFEFLTKPFRDQDLLDAVMNALDRDRAGRANEQAAARLNELFETLTAREREVMAQVVAGRLNKQIAADIGLSEITVKVHRASVMRKMAAKSFADLVLMADRLRGAADRLRIELP